MVDRPSRVVTDSMIGLDMPDIAVWSERVTVVLGQNPGPFTGPGTNTYLIGTGSRPLLLDTGQGLPQYLPLLERALFETRGAEGLQGIVLTHGHVDHLGGVAAIRARFGPLTVAKKPWAKLDGDLDPVPIDEGDVVRTEGATLRALWTPGHAWDHLCFYMPEERALFTGDVVLGAGTTVIPADGDLAEYLHSLRRLLDLDVAVIYPAHGPAIHAPREKIEAYLAHRALRDQQILDGLRTGERTIPGLVRRIYMDVPEFLHAAAAMSVHAHLRKLEREGVVARDGEQWALAT
jgi:glyoxylase-like metal-dependent hydrolase (beta-lactamase superfamily II)